MDKDLKEILNRIKFLKEDFEMIADGRWAPSEHNDSSIPASIENCDKIIEAVERINSTDNGEVAI